MIGLNFMAKRNGIEYQVIHLDGNLVKCYKAGNYFDLDLKTGVIKPVSRPIGDRKTGSDVPKMAPRQPENGYGSGMFTGDPNRRSILRDLHNGIKPKGSRDSKPPLTIESQIDYVGGKDPTLIVQAFFINESADKIYKGIKSQYGLDCRLISGLQINYLAGGYNLEVELESIIRNLFNDGPPGHDGEPSKPTGG